MAFPIIAYEEWVRAGQFLPLDDGKVFYVHKGTGFPVVLVHTFGGNSWWYCRVLDTIAEHFSVYAMDLPGCAQSEAPPLPYDIPDFADALSQFMDRLGIEKAHVVGGGGGAMMCVEFAAGRPSRVAKLVLESLPHWTRAEAKILWREWFRPKVLDENDQLKAVEPGDFSKRFPTLRGKVRALAVQREVKDFTGHRRWWLSMLTVGQLRYDVYTRLPLIEASTLLVNGSEGLRVGESYHRQGEEEIARAMKRSRLEIIPRAGVHSAFEQPQAYSKVVLDFLRASP